MAKRLKKPTYVPPIITTKTKKAEKYHKEIFKKAIESRLIELSKYPLTIFLCGPGRVKHLKLYKKRVDTTAELRKKDFNAFMGEEIVEELKKEDRDNKRYIRPDNIYEREVALESDLIVIFHEGVGAIAETHEFLSIEEIAEITAIWINRKYKKKGFSAKGGISLHEGKYRRVSYYSDPKDIKECNLLSEVIETAEEWRSAKWWFNQKS